MKNDIKWVIDPQNSEIGFKVKHLVVSHVKGIFQAFDASIYTTDNDFTTAVIHVWIDASSITTGNIDRDKHLKSSDFLDIQNHRHITFTSSTMGQPDLIGNHEIWGELTIKGTTRNVQLNIISEPISPDSLDNMKAVFMVTGKINRSDFGLTWNLAIETGGFMVGDEVTLSCRIELNNINQKNTIMQLEPIS
jgi:polyisoprenoid-binding protein YceI